MQQHVPVMLNEVLQYIPEDAKIVVDGTLGHWWHSKAILDKFSNIEKLIGFDLDPNIFENTKENLSTYNSRFIPINQSYTKAKKELENIGLKTDFLLLDLWVNMEHFKDESRWFSMNNDAVLDMRFDNTKGESAKDILNTYTMHDIADIFEEYADFSRNKAEEIAKTIIESRSNNLIENTWELKNILQQCGLGFKASIVIFQAIRIFVNKEMDNIKAVLDDLDEILNKGWICCVITYHSIEDRVVKMKFKELVDNSETLKLVNKKVLKPHYKEVEKNRASRSAKMRMIVKV